MKMILEKESGAWTFVAVEETEKQVLRDITAVLKPGEKLGYNGRGDDDEGFCTVRLHAAGHQEDISDGFVTRMGVWVGGIDLVLRGTNRSDKLEIGAIRDTCYFGSGGLIYLGNIEVDANPAIVVTACYCKLCGAAMVDPIACEWKVCDACAAKCQHRWIQGAVHGGSAGDIGFGEYCGICGRGKPKAEGEPEKSQLEHHLAVERELGFQIIYKDTGLTPSMVAHLQEIAEKAD